ncbi:MAG TPA: methyltransferase [Xanthobacteraceae bacterium]|nr:methyltransferase [Xanthobacteraceae bacterium]
MADEAPVDALTDDAVLGGRISLLQPRCGHRVGHDAILLAAATAAASGQHAVELGSGVGAAGIALAARVPGLAVTLVEIDPGLAGLAARNIRRNALSERMRAVALDVAAPVRAFAAAGLHAGSAQSVLMNPPFNDALRHNRSPDAGRRLAHVARRGLDPWMRCAARLLAPHGTLTLIWRADGLGEVIGALGGFGAVAVLPLHPRPDASAIRILLRAVRGSRGPLALRPGLTLADADGRPTPAAEAVLRHGAALQLDAAP